jgi:pilus assembly protein Flp/PilA
LKKPFINDLWHKLSASPWIAKEIAVPGRLKLLKTDAKGATAVEYGLILALIVLAMMAALTNLATRVNNMWYNVANKVNAS